MRADNCPVGGEPCQSLCEVPCTTDGEVARLRAALQAIWDKYQSGGARNEPTTGLAGTLAYMAKDALAPNAIELTGSPLAASPATGGSDVE